MVKIDSIEDLQALLEAIPIPVFVNNADSRTVFVNASACEFYCNSRERLLQEAPAEVFPAARARRFRETDRRVLATGEDVTCAEDIENAAGELRSIVTSKTLMTTARGERFVVGVVNDVTAVRDAQEHYRYSVELNPQIPWTAGPDGAVEEVGPGWAAVTGSPADEALGQGWTRDVHPEDTARVLAIWNAALETGEPTDVEFRVLSLDSGYRWFRAQASPRRGRDGHIIRWYGFLEDIQGRKLVEEALRESEERFRLAARAAGLGVWDYDAVAGTRTWSRGLREMFQLPADAPADPGLLRELFPHAEDRKAFDQLLRAAQDRNPDQAYDLTLRFHRYGEEAERCCAVNGWKVLDETGRLKRLLVTVRDITDERMADARLRHAALHDPLTALPNRSRFQSRLNSAIEAAAASGDRVGLLMLDVDHLKQVNDAHGHDAGDALLRMFAERLVSLVREGDTVARLGGDEFAVVLPEVTGKRDVVAIGDRIIAAMRVPFHYQGLSLACRPSIGASHFPSHGATAETLIKSADLALYTAKSTSRGSMVMFHSRMMARSKERRTRITVARSALREERIFPYYQPKVDLASGRITGFEALLRWRRGSGGVQRPATIAPALEDVELATEIGDLMLRRVLGDARGWLDGGVAFGSVAVNAGAAELQDKCFADRFLHRLHEAGVRPGLIQLEVVESVFLGRCTEHVESTLQRLSEAGVLIALDDFGTGYASLTHLKRFPVDIIKIDRSFVQGMMTEKGNVEIIDAVVGLGQSLSLSVVAEGVETAAQAAHLVKIGCAFGQGYHFSQAVPAKQVPALLSANRAQLTAAARKPPLEEVVVAW